MKRHKQHTVAEAEIALALRQTFDEMAVFILSVRDGLIDPKSAEGQAAIHAFAPRMRWLFYDATLTPPGPWKPTYYGLPEDEPLIKPKGTTK